MILVYGDDSADEKRQRVSAVAAVIGSEEAWDWIEPQWIARNNGTPFHAKNCESDHGDYEGRPHEENKALYKDLATMMAFSELAGLGIAVDLLAQRKVFPESLDLAYYKSFIEILDTVKNIAVRFREIAKFTFDVGTGNEYNAGLLYDQFRESDPAMREYFWREISFAPARECPRLQMADLMAYEAMKALDHTVGPIKRTRDSWTALRATERFETMSYSEEWFSDLKRNMGELERKVGFCKQDYLDWLKEHNRQHNVSNLFHFMNWIAKRGV